MPIQRTAGFAGAFGTLARSTSPIDGHAQEGRDVRPPISIRQERRKEKNSGSRLRDKSAVCHACGKLSQAANFLTIDE
jgi:hypothetical protein